MTDAIAGSGPLVLKYTSPAKTKAQEAKATAEPAAEKDTLDVGLTSKLLSAEPSFDSAKVAAIQLAIAKGNYPLDSKKMAESFAALEKMVNSSVSQESGTAN
jgi:negative regulator of flagellin synthesis FlgM